MTSPPHTSCAPSRAAFVLALIAGVASGWSHPLDGWQVRYSGSNGLSGVTFGGGAFVSVGERGTVLTSRSGDAWTPQVSGTSEALFDVVYGGGKFVAVGGSGVILSAADGTNWTTEASGVTNGLYSICYGSGLFMAGPYYGGFVTSSDGKDWTYRPTGQQASAMLCYGNGLFLCAGPPGTNLVSADGTSWSQRPSGSASQLYLTGFGGGVFVSIDINNRVYTSRDASNWVQSSSVALLRASAFAYGNGHWVLGGGGSLEYSLDTTNWTVSPSGYLYVTRALAFGNDTFVGVASDGRTGTIKQSDPLSIWLRSQTPGVLEILGPTGKSYNIEAAGNLMPGHSWTVLTNFTLKTSPQAWSDRVTPLPSSRVYRAVMKP